MAFCSHCGNEILEEAVVCPNCGCAVKKEAEVDNSVSTGLIILSFLIPLFGLIYWAVMAKSRPICAKKCGHTALISWGLGILLSILMTACGFLSIL